MNINHKEFFRYSVEKIGIAGIIFFITFVFRDIAEKTDSLLFKGIEFILSPFSLLVSLWTYFVNPGLYKMPPEVKYDIVITPVDTIAWIIMAAVGIIYWYTLACLIVRSKWRIIIVSMMVGFCLGFIITLPGEKSKTPLEEKKIVSPVLRTWLVSEGFEARVTDGGEEYLIKTGELRLAYDFHQYKQLGAELDRKQDQIRKIIKAILNTKRRRDLSSEEGRNEFKHELIEKINPILEKGKIEDVYFQIIIQKYKKTRRLR